MGAEQKMIDTQTGKASKGVPEILPERVDPLARVCTVRRAFADRVRHRCAAWRICGRPRSSVRAPACPVVRIVGRSSGIQGCRLMINGRCGSAAEEPMV